MKIEKNNYVYGIDPDKPRDKYQKGRRFKARVKNITPDKVELEVEEGVMSARLDARIGVGIGDIVEFEVTDRDEDRITLKHIKQEKIDDKFDMRIWHSAISVGASIARPCCHIERSEYVSKEDTLGCCLGMT